MCTVCETVCHPLSLFLEHQHYFSSGVSLPEADDAAEKDGDGVEPPRRDRSVVPQLVRDGGRQDWVHQPEAKKEEFQTGNSGLKRFYVSVCVCGGGGTVGVEGMRSCRSNFFQKIRQVIGWRTLFGVGASLWELLS